MGWSCPVSGAFAARFPNVVFGALTAGVIFALVEELFSVEVALLSALVWSAGIIAIIDNRLAKEDTLLVFFAWLGYYFFIRAEKARAINARQHVKPYGKWYVATGATFRLV